VTLPLLSRRGAQQPVLQSAAATHVVEHLSCVVTESTTHASLAFGQQTPLHLLPLAHPGTQTFLPASPSSHVSVLFGQHTPMSHIFWPAPHVAAHVVWLVAKLISHVSVEFGQHIPPHTTLLKQSLLEHETLTPMTTTTAASAIKTRMAPA
jgi:hypothetical protein